MAVRPNAFNAGARAPLTEIQQEQFTNGYQS